MMANTTRHGHGIVEPQPPLVGRTAERVLLSEQFNATLVGHGNLTIVGGEAGIGKTTLARDLVRQARAAGALVLPGFCHDLMAAPPYGLWLDLAERYRHRTDDTDLPHLPVALVGDETGSIGPTQTHVDVILTLL